MAYVLPLIFSFFWSCCSVFLNKRLNLIALALLSISIVFIAGLRWYSGADFEAYVEMYNDYPSLDVLFEVGFSPYYGEPGYILVNILAKHFGLFVGVLFMLFSFFSIAFKSVYLYRVCSNPLLAFFLYLSFNFITIEFIQIRWAVAVSLIAYALIIKKESTVAKFLIILFAASIQSYSLIFLFLIFIKDTCSRFSVIVYFFSGLVVVLFSLFIDIPMILFNGLALLDASNVYIYSRAVNYLSQPDSSVGFFSYAKITFYYMCFFCFVLFKARTYDVEFSPFDILLYKLSIILICLSLVAASIPVIFFRTMVVVDLFALVLIVNTIYKIKDIFVRSLIVFGLLCFGLAWYLVDLSNYLTGGGLVEYKTWLNFI